MKGEMAAVSTSVVENVEVGVEIGLTRGKL
jgi:hypothetical protein